MEEVKVGNNKMRKLCAIIFMFVVTTIVCGTAYFVATKEYRFAKDQILLQESEDLSVRIQNTVTSIDLWTDELNAQAKRVSTSELFRLFASDAATLTDRQVTRLNDDEIVTSSLSDQVPLMRNVFMDFMTLNGYADVRLLDRKGITLLSAQARPLPLDKTQIEVAMRSIRTNKVEFAPVTQYQKGVLLHFAEPLKPVLSQTKNEQAIATLLLSTPVTATISRFLAHDQGEKLQSYIIQKNGDFFEIVDVKDLNFKKMGADFAYGSEDELPFAQRFSVENQAVPVWSYGIHIPYINWWIVAEIPTAIIQEKLSKAAKQIYGLGAALTIGFMLVLALLWWIVIGREQKANAKRFESLYDLIGEQKRILDNVNAALDTGLLATDVTGKIIMANRAFGDLCSCDYENVTNENIALIFDPIFTHELLSGIVSTSQNGKPLTAEYTAILSNETRLLRLAFFPFLDNEVADGSEEIHIEVDSKETKKPLQKEKPKSKYKNATLITFTDITEFRRQSEAKRQVQEKSMQAFLRAVESMDPYLSGHSHRMEELGILVCKNLKLDDNDLNTVAIAANLSQVGKLFVPRELLLKTGELSAEEKEQLLSIPEKAWLTLKEIDFHLPVPQAVHDMYERLDGKGYPRQLSDANIGIHARILGIVNTFCAMTAPRSYRKGILPDEALVFLRNDQGYDQNIVNALESVLKSTEGLKLAQAVPAYASVKM